MNTKTTTPMGEVSDAILSTLTDDERNRIARARAAAMMGSIRSPRKAAASRENGKRGGRPQYAFIIRDGFNGDRKISSHRDLTTAAKAIDKLEREFYQRNPNSQFTLKIAHADGRNLDAVEREYVSAVEDGDAG